MLKTEVLQRLDATIERMKTLKEEQFNYNNFVSEYDRENNCGTVCCVAGWYPIWFPESGLMYELYFDRPTIVYKNDFIREGLRDFHGVNMDIINVLFYGLNDYFPLLKVKTDVLDELIRKYPNKIYLNRDNNSIELGVAYTGLADDKSLQSITELFSLVRTLIAENLISYKINLGLY